VFTSFNAASRMRALNTELEKETVELVSPRDIINPAARSSDDAKNNLVQSRDLVDVRISSANSAIRQKVLTQSRHTYPCEFPRDTIFARYAAYLSSPAASSATQPG
jgi:hypothetical protein